MLLLVAREERLCQTSRVIFVQGTLDMLILKTLALEPIHGYGNFRAIETEMSKAFSA